MIAKLLKKKLIAENTIEIKLQLPEKAVFKPGNSFRLAFGTDNRFFSIVNSPTEDDVLVTAMRLGPSNFKKTIEAMVVGGEAEVTSIAGTFVMPDQTSEVVLIAGGIGITPFISMLRHENEINSKRKIVLIYSNPDEASCAYLEELKSIEHNNSSFKLILKFTEGGSASTRLGEAGDRLDAEFLKKYISGDEEFMISGAPIMVNDIYNILLTLGIGSRKIKTEEFTGY